MVTHEKALKKPSKTLAFQPPASCDLCKICKIKQCQNRKTPLLPQVQQLSEKKKKKEEQQHLHCAQNAESENNKWDYNEAKSISEKENRLFSNLNLVNPFLFNIVVISFPFNVSQLQLVICEYSTMNRNCICLQVIQYADAFTGFFFTFSAIPGVVLR